jgi:hypothetical protein
MRAKRSARTNSGAVEVLADGKCFVLSGGHASGVRYSHCGSRIPTLSLEQLNAYLATVGSVATHCEALQR